jgi:UDP-N-acetylglucosamine 3-dehydrogenase
MLKIGVIGTGSMGKNHIRVCSEKEGMELVGLVDQNVTLAETIAKRFSIKAFKDYKEMMPKIDAAIIATPTSTHHQIALDLLNHGKHVLVEKPISNTINQAEELVTTAEKEHLILAVGHIERHNPSVKFVKDALTEKKFGELITLTSRRVSNFPNRIKDIGVMMDLGIHDIDIMHFLAGDVKSVYAKAGKFNKDITYEDYANIILNFENDKCGIIEVNWLTPMKVRKMFLTCSENFVEINYIDQSVTISSSSFRTINEMDLYHVPIEYNVNKVSLEKREPLKNELDDFLTAIHTHHPALATGEDGLTALKIAEAATTSYKTGAEVIIP